MQSCGEIGDIGDSPSVNVTYDASVWKKKKKFELFGLCLDKSKSNLGRQLFLWFRAHQINWNKLKFGFELAFESFSPMRFELWGMFWVYIFWLQGVQLSLASIAFWLEYLCMWIDKKKSSDAFVTTKTIEIAF